MLNAVLFIISDQAGVAPPTVMNDIMEVVEAIKKRRSIDDEQKAYLIKNRSPSNAFAFPAREYKDKSEKSGKKKRSCYHGWFQQHDFLAYSKNSDGLFCLCCVLFPVSAKQGSRSNLLITTPYRNWKDAKADLRKHAVLEYHKDASALMRAFLNSTENPHSRVDQILSVGAGKTIERNRRFLESIIRCLEYCGRQGIALRGHRDDGKPDETYDTQNLGNFKTLINLISRTDHDLQEHLQTCLKNATYISKTTQNDLLQCMMDYIQGQILEEINAQGSGPFYGLVADEVTDVSNWEQLGVIVRYLKDDVPVERLLEYVKCEDITGKSIADYIIKCVINVGLDPMMCRSQTYDGAGNMAGRQKGAANQFRENTNNSKAIYFHCASHELNLALSKASKVPEVHNMVCLMQSVGLFFKFSPKRQREFEKAIGKFCENNGSNNERMKSKLKPLCETRWVERHTSFDDLKTLYEPLLNCLDNIESNHNTRWDPKTVTEASGLNANLRNAKFIVPFTACHYIFGFTKGLSRLLQGTTLDIITAYDKVEGVTDELEAIRNDGDAEFSRLFNTSSQMSDVAGVPLSKPRVVGRQSLRSNVDAENVEEYYRRSIFLPFIDHLISQLKDRFVGRSTDAMKALFMLPNNLHKMDEEIENTISTCYEDDLPCHGDF
nr:52 kDa repressor of the inhibitor of the protein kinase-like [Lytechinus pictus]